MKSRELVLQALEFRCPERMPFAKGPEADIAMVAYRPAAGFTPPRAGVDEWGCRWQSLNAQQGDKGQVVEHPLADWDGFAAYRFPDPMASGRLDHLPAQLAALRQADRFICGSLGSGPMHLLDYLRGFENYLMDLMTEPERTKALLDGIFGFLTGMVRQYGRYGLDGVFMLDDQAMQSGPLFSMELWREHLKPRYAGLFGLVHQLGMKVYLHSCGNLREHLVDLCEVGVDLLDNKQPALWMDCEAVEQVRGRMAFSTCLDIQAALPLISAEEIRPAVTSLVQRLSVPQGGFVATYYHQPDLQIPAEKTSRMLAEFKAFAWQ